MKEIIFTKNSPNPIGPYSQAIKHNNLLFTSGQIAIDPKTDNLILENIKAETRQVMENLNQVLTEAGFGFDKVLKTTIFLSDMNYFTEVNEIYGSYFKSNFPARETVQVAGLPRNVNVEISMIAAL
jgi:2-iminobutanoate/2-iminopropanoate deaminase